MLKILDLTHRFTQSMPVHPYDEKASLKKIRNLNDDKYNDWLLSSSMHVGTHIDGPGHLTQSQIVIADISPDRFVGKGYLIDARNKAIDQSLLQNMPYQEGLIVLIITGTDKNFGTQKYFEYYPTLSAEFAKAVAARKIKMLGIDCCSPDNYPFDIHKIFFDNDILIIENLTSLESLLNVQEFTVIALPLKTDTDSALARVIAIING